MTQMIMIYADLKSVFIRSISVIHVPMYFVLNLKSKILFA